MDQLWLWAAFNGFVLAMLAVDLFVFHREAHIVRTREAAVWSAVWVALAVLFGIGVYTIVGRDAGLEYFAGYLIEKARTRSSSPLWLAPSIPWIVTITPRKSMPVAIAIPV